MSFKHGKIIRNGWILFILSVLFSGCSNTGNLMSSLNSLSALTPNTNKYDINYLKQNIIPGKTTKSQINQMFGAPSSQELDSTSGNNQSNWSYAKNEEGLDKYMKLAQKYVSSDTQSKLYEASAQVSKAQGVVNDVNSVSGTNTALNNNQGRGLIIYFVDDVVKYYRLY